MSKKLFFSVVLLSSLTVFGQITTNGVFVPVQSTGTPTYEIVAKGVKPNNNPFVIGKTYNTAQGYSIITTNDTVTLRFSNGLNVKVETNSNFSAYELKQEMTIPSQPGIPKLGSHVFTTALQDGEAVFVFDGTDSNSMCSVSTSLCDFELLKGKFYFQCSEKSVIVFVLEGSLKYHSEHNRTGVVEAGKALAVVPVQHQMKGLDDKVFINSVKVKPDQLATLLADATSVDKSPKVLFVVVNGELIGINLD